MSNRWQGIAAVLGGLALAAYPALRPYADGTGADTATEFAATGWVLSHGLGMLGLVLLALWLDRVLAWVAVALVLPYFGAETFGLWAVASESPQVAVSVAEAFRFAPAAVVPFGAGLLLLAVLGLQVLRSGWRAGGASRAAMVLVGVGLATYLPQFFLPGELRTVHGVLLGAGLVWAGLVWAGLVGPGRRQASDSTRSAATSASETVQPTSAPARAASTR